MHIAAMAMLATLSTSQVEQAPDAATPTLPPPAPQESEQFFRLRMGLGGSGGEFNPGSFILLGVGGRLGVTLGELLAVYVDLGYTFGVAVASGGRSGEALDYAHAALLAEATLFNHFFLAAGPMVASGGWTTVTPGSTGIQTVSAGSFALPGIDLRAGFGFGSHSDSGRRHQLTITGDAKFLFTKITAVSATSLSKVGDNIVGVAFTLMLGWDAK